eukprot:TRINITY_DN1226_c0_g1_i1.p1 TRINITY_DN1226_c0_g1~~TRINITY_DN1226_c0_g1_i1.p1  ORF type:complete len:214 (+),score=29.23 TRINITY_DN1226_c0_g1_i1:346-987(+)
MATIEEKYKGAGKLLLGIRSDLEMLETGKDTSILLQSRLATNISSLERITDSLDSMVGTQDSARRDIWRFRVKQLYEDTRSLKKPMEQYLQKISAKKREEDERNALLDRRIKGSGAGTNMDLLMKEGSSVAHSNTMLEDIEAAGGQILGALSMQNDRIRAAQGKLVEMANTLGLSRSIIRKIEQRTFMDKLIVYFGMVITLIIFAVVYYYFRM